MSALSCHYSARNVAADTIEAHHAPDLQAAPIVVNLPDLAIYLPRDHAVRLVDHLTAALAEYHAAREFHQQNNSITGAR